MCTRLPTLRSTLPVLCFFFNDTATTEIYTLSLHDALPIWAGTRRRTAGYVEGVASMQTLPWLTLSLAASACVSEHGPLTKDRKSTRLNSSHGYISYAVFCLKKKNIQCTARNA